MKSNNLPQTSENPPKIQKILTNPIMNILENTKIWHNPSMEDFVREMQNQQQKKINEKRRQEKEKILKNELGKTPEDIKNRPTLDFLDENDIKNITEISDEKMQKIVQFMTLHNLACAFGCCGDKTYPERVQEIADIFRGNYGEKFVHFHLYQEIGWTKNDWEKVIADDNEEALEYFQVFLKNIPQNIEEKNILLKEFQRIYFLAKHNL